ncbi:MAG: DUF4397 domain-containing protein [Chloroflexota bacterium]|nr:DUF4397 domain-containing protein [Chloroflexota bacterium]
MPRLKPHAALGGVLLCLVAVLTLALVLPASVVRAQDDVARADATVRIIHASPDAPAVDVLLDGQPLLENVKADSASDYQAITSETHRIQVVPAGQTADAALVDEEIDAAPGAAYIVAIYGRLNDLQGAVIDVDLSEIEPGNARVRLINLSPDAGAVDLAETGGDVWFDDVDLGEVTDYRDVTPGGISADLRGDEDRVLQTIPELGFAEARVYDVVVLGQLADDSLTVVNLATRVSPPCAEVLDIAGSPEDACVRVVHAAPDAPAIDAYINDAQVAADLSFGTATEYAVVPSGGDRGVRVVAAGGDTEESILDDSFDLDPGQAYEILVQGGGTDLGFAITGVDLRPVAENQARMRVIHASPDAGVVNIGVEGDEANLFEGVDFGNATEYVILDAGNYPIEVRPGDEDMTVALRSDITLEEGMVYDLVAIGRPDDRSLTLLVLTAPVAIQTGEMATPVAMTGDEPLAGTVEPETLTDGTSTPTS